MWQPGDGASHETQWTLPYLTQAYTQVTTTQDQTVCKQWGFDADGNAVCLQWQTIPGTKTTTPLSALYYGSSITYDGRGRVIASVDPNSVKTQMDYFGAATLPPGVSGYVGPIRRVILGPGTAVNQVTWYESDVAGRSNPALRFSRRR